MILKYYFNNYANYYAETTTTFSDADVIEFISQQKVLIS